MVRMSNPYSGCWDEMGKGPDTVPDTRQMLNKCKFSFLSPTCPSAPAKLICTTSPTLDFPIYMPLSWHCPLLLIHSSFKPSSKLVSSGKASQVISAGITAPSQKPYTSTVSPLL